MEGVVGVWETDWKLKPALCHKSARLIATPGESLEGLSNPDNEDVQVLVDAGSPLLDFETCTTYRVSPRTRTDQRLFARGLKQKGEGTAGTVWSRQPCWRPLNHTSRADPYSI